MTERRKVYRIRRESDGKYATGGCAAGFSTRGKLWTSMGALKNHIHRAGAYNHYRGCTVVESEVVDTGVVIPARVLCEELYRGALQRQSLPARREQQRRERAGIVLTRREAELDEWATEMTRSRQEDDW